MSNLASIGLLATSFAIALSVGASVRRGQNGPISRSDDPLAFWSFIAFLLVIVALGLGIVVARWSA